ncbi:HigA family addiction module antitoxin [Thiocapsa marina]|uniref:Plasmid maintenance system antidote protein, XRE family n=1 Tax=Thiocapsa marina 5811 TaxID=768671 RepID=F9U6T0_9GAMM|nr:HigA family addiction module antitoxin [Thiocapsa marina]EGV19956.1 plasmid maintenance system antidote protein, XRE family [Thiocapsa marina 5811]
MVNEQRNEYVPDYAVPPGEVLEYELELRHMPKSELARRTGLTEKHINTIVKSKGKSCITPETAIKLERALGMPADYWLNLETNYQEACALERGKGPCSEPRLARDSMSDNNPDQP